MRPLLTFLKGPGVIIPVLIVFFVAFYFIRHRREAAAVATAAAAKNTPAKTLGNVNPERRTVQPGSQTLRETVPGNVIVPATSNLPDTDAPVVRATPTHGPGGNARGGDPAAPSTQTHPELFSARTRAALHHSSQTIRSHGHADQVRAGAHGGFEQPANAGAGRNHRRRLGK